MRKVFSIILFCFMLTGCATKIIVKYKPLILVPTKYPTPDKVDNGYLDRNKHLLHSYNRNKLYSALQKLEDAVKERDSVIKFYELQIEDLKQRREELSKEESK